MSSHFHFDTFCTDGHKETDEHFMGGFKTYLLLVLR